AELAARIERRITPRMRRVINLTGTVIHTNLGRAVLPERAIEHLARMMEGPVNLEYDLDGGARGERDGLVEDLLCEITGAEAATASAGATSGEVGTTNRTHLADYARAITPRTSLLVKVHTSNYAVQGFTATVPESELARLARERSIALLTDLGSGSLVDMTQFGLPKEPRPQEMLAAGCDVVTFSGDKLLGGPQAGLVVGRRDAIARIRGFPMKRALRLSKLPLAALEATLALYLQPELLARELPTLRWLARPVAQVRHTADALLEPLRAAMAPRYTVRATDMMSQVGSGSLPVDRLPSAGLACEPVLDGRRGAGTALDALAAALRGLPVPIIGRIAEDRLLLDCRCLDDPAEV